VSASVPALSASEAARQLGVSIKALRLYEKRGLLTPARTPSGYRVYSPDEMARAVTIVTLRALGLSLSQVARVLEDDPQCVELALATHEATLGSEGRKLAAAMEKVRTLRAELARGRAPTAAELTRMLTRPFAGTSVAFDLPWPWGGERFELSDIRAITYIVGPLGSGKTRLARRLAEALPGGVFLGLERLKESAASSRLADHPALKLRVDQTLAWLVDEGAVTSDALAVLLIALEDESPGFLIVDMVEEGLDQPTQEALIACLRQRATTAARPLFLMTRSSAILDLAAVGPEEAILLCPANHGPPIRVVPRPGAPGSEAVAMCLASPEVRARTAGVIALRPGARS